MNPEGEVERQIQASLDQASDGIDSSDDEAAFQDARTQAWPNGPDELFHDARQANEGTDAAATPVRPPVRPHPSRTPSPDPDVEQRDAEAEATPELAQLRLRRATEAALSPAQRELKQSGNAAYLASQNVEAVTIYSEALALCPLCFTDDRAVLLANRAAAQFKQGDLAATIQDCSESLELKPDYLKALVRRAQAYEDHDKPHEALKDFEKVLTLDPKHAQANVAARVRLPEKVKIKDEQLKAEMMTNLKKLGNMVLNPFGLSTENFQFVQDPESGNYSVNFSQGNKS
ncbi:hypothetical protein TCAL_10210 [Tigriopus californicus]|uniref:Uncharacterized protein n=1 Tax=Tigriopus californicus TaxID=6832 RepID=A0A553PF23_TIGCA|nr:hypothetical protein TCAL_10210 [Tigriopus californicus]